MNNIAIIGGGVAGLSSAYYLAKKGHNVTIFEAEKELGGLAGSFTVGGSRLEKFYHHWFTSDSNILSLINELGLADLLDEVDSNTAVFVGNSFFKLSNPLDLLKFSPLSFSNRLRLGLVTILLRFLKDWHRLESYTAAEWLTKVYGKKIFEVLWLPLLRGKFGKYWNSVSAVWMWNKLKLRGGSRKNGKEKLLYLKGGFEILILRVASKIKSLGGKIHLNSEVKTISYDHQRYKILVNNQEITFDKIIFTIPLSKIGRMCNNILDENLRRSLDKFKYLSNVCVVLKTKKSLTDHYWVNVNDPEFPFVAVIEHTNFQSKSNYNDNHLIYLSKYCDKEDNLYLMSDKEVVEFTKKCLKKMFIDFDPQIIIDAYVWRADFSQPIVEKNYSKLIKSIKGLPKGLHIASMALIYPEDRGTNYAVLQGKNVASEISLNYKSE